MRKVCFTSLKSLASILFLLPIGLKAQSPSGYIADWKGDADGAYSIIHDDYGDPGVDGIWQYADTICNNRGIKFTFGAIANSCEGGRIVNGYSNPYEYAKNVMIAQHEHEIISHSHTHDCAVGAAWNPCDIAPNWGENPNSANFNQQLRTAHNSIITGTGFTPVYYIFPYDRFTHAANDTLKSMGYIGSRTGWSSPYFADPSFHRNGYENSDLSSFYPDADGFFRTAVQVFDDTDAGKSNADQTSELNEEVDDAINNNLWANRELHNVGTTGAGWGEVNVNAYRDHIDYLKSKVASGQLWVGTVSEIITYQIQKLKYSPNINYVASSDKIFVTWNSIGAQYNVDVESYLNDLSIKTPITLVVDLDGLSGEWMVKQDNSDLNTTLYSKDGNKLYINVYPHEGDLEIYKAGDVLNNSPFVDNDVADFTSLIMDFEDFTIDLKYVFEDNETSDNNLVYTATGYSGINVIINNCVATVSSTSGWTGSTSITFTVEDEGGLKISDISNITVTDLFSSQTPFVGMPISIPGRVEVEDFDEGGNGISFNEINNGWDPDPADNPYRPGNSVDIDLLSNMVDYGIGYTVAGEWLEYTVDVTITGWYNVTFNVAQPSSVQDGQLKLYIDNAEWLPAKDMPVSGAWGTYIDYNYPKQLHLKAGKHLLKLEFIVGDVNVNYLDIVYNPTSTGEDLLKSDFTIYPNPASNKIQIDGEFEVAEIYAQTGELVKTSKSNVVDLSDISEGVYFIKLDNSSVMQKIVVSK